MGVPQLNLGPQMRRAICQPKSQLCVSLPEAGQATELCKVDHSS